MVLKQEILKLKEQEDAVILAHNYQCPQIQEIADYLGDSLELAKISRGLTNKTIVFCGVQFMAETAKILSPAKEVFLPIKDAGCPLADMITVDQLKDLKKQYPDAWVVSYVNSAAEIKALSDVCCTSSNAIKIVQNIPAKQVLFVPDKNLGWWVKHNVPEKEVIVWEGFCLVHQAFTLKDLDKTREQYPNAPIIVHPECPKEVVLKADSVESTAGMIRYVKESDAKIFVIGTEEGMIYRLQQENPDKKFVSLGVLRICTNMKKITMQALYESLHEKKHKIVLPVEIMDKARTALERMLKYL